MLMSLPSTLTPHKLLILMIMLMLMLLFGSLVRAGGSYLVMFPFCCTGTASCLLLIPRCNLILRRSFKAGKSTY